MKYAKTLNRDEMKNVKAGDGNIYCMVNGNQHQCHGGSLHECTEYVLEEFGHGYCGQFPEEN